MKNTILKKVVAMMIVVTCIIGMSVGTSATSVQISFSGCPSGSNRGPVGYSSYKVTPNAYWLYPYVSSVGFVGLPAEVWPTNKAIFSSLYTNTDTQSTLASFSAKNQIKTVYVTGPITSTYRVGAATSASQGATIQEKW